MRLTMLVPLCLFAAAALPAQVTISIVPDTVTAFSPDPETEAPTWIYNLDTASVTVRWRRTILLLLPDSAGTDCVTAMEDNNLHYPPHVGQGTPVTIEPGDSSHLAVLLFSFNPDFSCCALVQVEVTDVADSTNTASAFFQLNECTTGLRAPELLPARVFPNPAADFFRSEFSRPVDRLQLFNADGKCVGQWEAVPGRQYPVGGLATGSYILLGWSRGNRLIGVAELKVAR